MPDERETPMSRPPKYWVLEKAEHFEELAKRPDYSHVSEYCLEEAAKLRRWADDLL
jgi:hypothetical protein